MAIWDIKEFETLWRKLNVPKKYESMRCNFEVLATHDIVMNLSVREDSGKTTQAILYALCFNALWNVRTAYCRSDHEQISRSNIEELCDKFGKLGYVELAFNGKYNIIKYQWNTHKFYLGYRHKVDDEVIDEMNDTPFMYAVCNEDYIKYKSSGFDDDDLNFMIYDEFMDSSRATNRQMIEFMNNISTFGRPLTRQYTVEDKRNKYHGMKKPKFRVLMLGNNTQLYSQWFEEFCIEDDIVNLKFGSFIDRTTELGTTFACHLLATSEEFKEKRIKSNIPFFGFNTPKMNAFNGLQEWQSESHAHLPQEDYYNKSTLLGNNVYIHHRNKYIKLELLENNDAHYVFAHYNKKPIHDDSIILTLNPTENNEYYGFANNSYKKVYKYISYYIMLIKSNKIYFSSNSVGDLFSNYCKEFAKNKNYL